MPLRTGFQIATVGAMDPNENLAQRGVNPTEQVLER